MSLAVGPVQAGSALVASAALSSAGLLEALQISVAEGLTATAVLRTTLTPLHEETSHQDRLGLSDPVRTDLGHFVEGRHEEPSEGLLSEFTEKAPGVRVLLASLPGGEPPIEAQPAKGPLDYPGHRVADALARDKAALRAGFERLEAAVDARAGVVSVPPALSLEDALAHPEQYQDRELEIVLTDVDGTTRRGQYWLEWLLFDVLRFGPKNSTGLGLWRLVKTLIPSIALRIQEKRDGVADPEKTAAVMAKALKGLDAERVQRSFDRYYEGFGRRNVSPYMKEEIAYHRSKGRLILGVSASPEYIVRRHAEDLGIPVENFFGTTIEVDPETNLGTGKYHLMRAQEKVTFLEEKVFARLRERGIRYRVVYSYSDSDSDVPMFERSKKDGATVVATNAPREKFEAEVLRGMGGMVVQEDNGWPGTEGERRTVLFSSKDGGQLMHVAKTPVERPPVLDDLYGYGGKVAVSAVAFSAANPISQAVTVGLEGLQGWGIGDIAGAGVASLVAGAGDFLIPRTGPDGWMRRWILRDMAPLASAAYLMSGPEPFSPIAFLLSLTASTLSTHFGLWTLGRIAHGFGAKKLERVIEGKSSELMARPVQMTLYRIFYPFAHFLETRYLHGG